jgi:uncharacterized protein (DUF1697 family)
MPVYVSMLRGINVGPHKRMKMEDLRQAAAKLRFANVRTYLQSGNLVFEAAETDPEAVSRKLEKQIVAEFGLQVPVVSRTAAEMLRVTRDNPFAREPGVESKRLYVAFLSCKPTASGRLALSSFKAEPDRCHCVERQVYLDLQTGAADTRLSNAALERLLSVVATTRNWNTVNALCQMLRGES